MMWERVKLADVSDSCLGKMLDQRKNKGIYKPYLANVNVRWGAFDLDNLQEMKFEDDEDERYGIKYGDLIICEGGEPGRCAIWKEQLPNMKIQKALHRLRVNEEMDYRYDMLFRDDLSKNDIKKLKEVATTLLRKIKNRIAEIDHWTDKQETKAEIDNLIRNILYDELPLCYDEISISTYRQRIYEYVYTRYKSVA